MEGSIPSYRTQLQSRFDQRKAARPAYSLRAFARDLGYGAPQLSRVINGKQHLSLATARSIADRLFDSDRDRELFVTQVELESAGNEKAREAAQVKLERIQNREFGEETVMLGQEDFLVISDWYHVPILYLTGIQGAPTTVAGIAKFLGIGKAEAGQDVERRYLSGRTIGIAPKDMPKFRALVDDFLARASVLAAESEHRSKLYQFNVQMFDLDATADLRSPKV